MTDHDQPKSICQRLDEIETSINAGDREMALLRLYALRSVLVLKLGSRGFLGPSEHEKDESGTEDQSAPPATP